MRSKRRVNETRRQTGATDDVGDTMEATVGLLEVRNYKIRSIERAVRADEMMMNLVTT